ncbi:ATP-dependent DNA helicase [Corynebacterium suicordis]|nr:ATP-dependent DNA helicase [Corynebacterium suicordis]MDR6277022.1 ATP-dependent DNA helicase DinG [Corynebacterium suicordis]
MTSQQTSTQKLLQVAVESLGGSPREGQQRMADAVHQAMSDQEHLAVQAGTGTGKSLAYLVPAVQQAMDADLPVIISTATIALQRQLVERDLPRLAESLKKELPRPLESAILKGRNNYLCLNKVHGGAKEAHSDSGVHPDAEALLSPEEISHTGAQVKRLHEWAAETEDGDRDNLDRGVSDQAWRQVSVNSRECLGASRCPYGDQCFAELARAKASEADIVVTNHALLAIDAMADAPVLPEHDVVVVDEAHELVSRITSAATAELSPMAVAILAKRVEKLAPKGGESGKDAGAELEDAGDAWNKALDSAIAASGRAGSPDSIIGRWTEVPIGLDVSLAALRDAAWKANRMINGIPPGEFSNDPTQAAERQAILAATEELHDTVQRVLEASAPDAAEKASDLLGEDVVWLSSELKRKQIFVAPLSVADLLRQRLFSQSTVILTSATLALGGKFSGMMAQWGLKSTATTLDVGTPFEARTHGILYVASHLDKPGREGANAQTIDETAQLINAAGGRTLGLFSSRRAAEEMADQLRGVVPHKILLQGEDSMSSLVERFREDESTCLFGTLGLWQGVDVPGPSLSLVIIDRIPFPRPDDPLMKARQEAAAKAGRNGFMEVAATHAALLLAQGAGRLLRSVDDRGMVAVLDQRLATARYGSFLRNSMPDFWETTSQKTALAALRRLIK